MEFEDLNAGNKFIALNRRGKLNDLAADNQVMMKLDNPTEKYNAVNLQTAELVYFKAKAPVQEVVF